MGGFRLSPLVLGWVFAALLRLSVGSATVACVTAASIMTPIVGTIPGTNRDLLVVAIGAGSRKASHLKDGGFWLVKEYFGMTVPQTVVTWTVLETILSVLGLVGVLLLGMLVA
jgi:GntP family gluconate:H+ symporter